MEIRKGTAKDAPRLAELGAQLNMDHQKRFPGRAKLAPDYAQALLKYFSKIIRKQDHVFFLAIENGQIIGSILGKEAKDPPVFKETRICQIGDFFVLPEYRNRGIGTKLFAEIKKWAKKRKLHTIEIGYYSENTLAKKLYKEMGFGPHKELLRLHIK